MDIDNTERMPITIRPDRHWLLTFGVVKAEPIIDVSSDNVTYRLLACYDYFVKKYAEMFGGYGEILAHRIPLKYVYDPDWISLLQNGDVLFFRLRDRTNKIVEDIDQLRAIVRKCAPDKETYYNALGVYYHDNVFCCLYFRYSERLRQRTKFLRKSNKGKITITFL